MAAEHQKRPDSSIEFTTGNYGVTTTSTLEWLFVVEPTASTLTRMGRDSWASEAEDSCSAKVRSAGSTRVLGALNGLG